MRIRFPAAALAVLSAAALAACSHAQPAPDTSQQAKKEEAPPPAPEKSAEQQAADYKAEGQAELNKAMDRLKEVSVFFEFDEHTLTKEARERLDDVATILGKHPELKVKIEGHADERGTPDYNLALGQRRAESTKAYLVKMGVKDGQIEKTISYGSEKPKATGHNEESWRQNRRGDVSAADEK